MTKKNKELSLDELRAQSEKSKTSLSFEKKMIGGYDQKQVTEYINKLTADLNNAEETFNSRLEDYTSMITMLKQERDQYGEMYNICKSSKIEMLNQIDELKKENDTLNQLITELSVDSKTKQSGHNQELLETTEKIAEDHEALKYEQESIELKKQLDQLKQMVKNLNEELANYAQDHLKDSHSEDDFIKNNSDDRNVIKSQYEDILKERGALLIENKRLLEENEKTKIDQINLTRENERLQALHQKYNLKIQELTSEYESNLTKFVENHQKIITQFSENMPISFNQIIVDETNRPENE
ncbi:coiled-coil domain-containing protein [Acetobacterium woodii]|uniref:Uncharacterized protein n=1 Tax=Acetobacterium woodii (strain ATCC 29683 / DSM 1030 / JCM 2381 / KCTC 1655 / WB1) TaxID=931626 RepID=H6LJV8_ACEWD|nr:hypothetical protein [Acetobacterium woodii]AFA48712.1 hypothetical protein Awo_c19330 [Acetobacterium woodii DSM 1030]